jgi:hypothetical protein
MRPKKLRPKPVIPGGPSSTGGGGTARPGGVDDAEPSDADLAGPATPPMRTSGLQQMGSALGGIIAGIENQVFGRPPPGPVLVRHATPSGVKGPDGTEFVVDFPDDAPGPPPPTITGSTRTGG